jgi:nickel/cobalt transporter (NiCoT) family protein
MTSFAICGKKTKGRLPSAFFSRSAGLSVAVALLVGTIELLQVFVNTLDLHGPFYDFISALDFGVLGYFIVGMFMLAWPLSV